MKIHCKSLFALSALLACVGQALAQGTAFTYQGRLSTNGVPVTGLFDFQFSLRDALTAGSPVGTTNTLAPVGVTNGVFSVTLDFGSQFYGPPFGTSRWLEIAVRTNGSASAYTNLAPRQPLLPVPYAMYAANAGPASSFTGSLFGDVTGTEFATVVSIVGGQTAANVANGASAANAATDLNVTSRIVSRNASGNFSAGLITASFSGNGGGLTNLNATNLVGTIGDPRLSANVALLGGSQTFSGAKAFSTEISANNSIRLNGSNIWFLGGSDVSHGLGYFGTANGLNKFFGGSNPDGPVLFGYGGGALGSINGGAHAMLTWTPQQVFINSTNAGGWGNSVAFIENKSTNAGSAAPAERLQAAGNLVDGVLSVSSTTGVGYIARFGNQAGYLLDITTNGNVQASGTVTAGGFSGPGAMSWQTVSGTSQTAQPNKGYLLTNDVLVTVTLPASANLNEVLRVSGTGVNGWKIAQNAGQSVLTKNLFGTIGVNWIARDSNRFWKGVASSADGTKLVATVFGGQIYTSSDSGVTWTARDNNRIWGGGRLIIPWWQARCHGKWWSDLCID